MAKRRTDPPLADQPVKELILRLSGYTMRGSMRVWASATAAEAETAALEIRARLSQKLAERTSP